MTRRRYSRHRKTSDRDPLANADVKHPLQSAPRNLRKRDGALRHEDDDEIRACLRLPPVSRDLVDRHVSDLRQRRDRLVWHAAGMALAHRSRRSCDPWWENESDWHRSWKNHFPAGWQEIVLSGPYGQRHIADVKTAAGLVLEFQHSPLAPMERHARENFYRNMA